jgi:hypothetical protein|tara:strand:+ start:436 stop:867 length:432 start_codon:yes stop_codon:yes gene_type:complete
MDWQCRAEDPDDVSDEPEEDDEREPSPPGNAFRMEAKQQVDAWRMTRRKDKVRQPDGTTKSTTFPTIKKDKCTLAYFRIQLQQDTIFPGVVELARRVLPCPPSTAPVERIFSVAGQVEKSAKYQLTDATLAMQTTLREVWDMV